MGIDLQNFESLYITNFLNLEKNQLLENEVEVSLSILEGTSSGIAVQGLSVPTPNTEILELNPALFTPRILSVKMETGNCLIKIQFPRNIGALSVLFSYELSVL